MSADRELPWWAVALLAVVGVALVVVCLGWSLAYTPVT